MGRELFMVEGEELAIEDAKIDLVTVARQEEGDGSETIEWIEGLSSTELRALWFVVSMMRDEGRAAVLREISIDKPDLRGLAQAIYDSTRR